MIAAEEIVPAFECNRPDLVLSEVVVGQQPSVVKHAHHGVPPRVGICDGLAGLRALAEAETLGLQPFLHLLHQRP